MSAKHKFQNAKAVVSSTLSSDQLIDLAQRAGESVTNRIPGQPAVQVIQRSPSSILFKVTALGGMREMMSFTFDVTSDGRKRTGTSQIKAFQTSQPSYLFVPIGPKSLLGWAQYKRFATTLSESLRAADGAATFSFTERPA